MNLEGVEHVTDNCLRAISSGLKSLHSINLNNCTRVSDAGAEVLARGCKMLTSMSLQYCNRLTVRIHTPLLMFAPVPALSVRLFFFVVFFLSLFFLHSLSTRVFLHPDGAPGTRTRTMHHAPRATHHVHPVTSHLLPTRRLDTGCLRQRRLNSGYSTCPATDTTIPQCTTPAWLTLHRTARCWWTWTCRFAKKLATKASRKQFIGFHRESAREH